MVNMARLHLLHEPELAHELDLVVIHAVSGDAVTVDLEQVRELQVERPIGRRDLTLRSSQWAGVSPGVGALDGNLVAGLNG